MPPVAVWRSIRRRNRGRRSFRSPSCINARRFQYEEHTEELGPGDMLLYDSGRGHGMIAIDGAPCKFLAVVLKAKEDII